MSFKTFDLAHDVASIVSSINEVVSVSSSIFNNDLNTKFFKNIASASADLGGYWESIYDSSPTSSVSTALFDITYGFATGSLYNVANNATSSLNEKIKVYREFASVLLGNSDSVFNINSSDRKECLFISVKRNIQKDEIKKGSVSLIFNVSGTASQVTGSDDGSVSAFKQAVGGDYSTLKYAGTGSELGQVWYNAGVIVVPLDLVYGVDSTLWSGSLTLAQTQTSATINNVVDGFRQHLERFSFHNQTNLYSTVYFCRANNSEFNYSSNPTFVDGDKRIRVTSGSNILQTRTYITTVGLYDSNDNLLAVAKVNKPITKSPDTEAIFRIRLDY